MKMQYKVAVLAVLAGVSMWIVTCAVDALGFSGGDFPDLLVGGGSSFRLLIRVMHTIVFLTFGLIVAYCVHKRRVVARRTRQSEDRLRLILRHSSDGMDGDTTERVRAEKELQKSQATVQALLSAAAERAALRDLDGTILAANDAVAKGFNTTVSELIGKNTYDLVSPELARRRKVFHQRAIRLRKSVRYQDQRDGRWLDHNAHPIPDENGQITRLAVFTQDVTEQKQTEDALRKERDLLSRIMATSPAGITVADGEGRIVFVSDRAEQVLGLTRKQITRRTCDDPGWGITDHRGLRFPRQELPFRQVKTTRKSVYDVRYAVTRPDGRRVLLSVNAAPLLDESGNFDGVVATINDVTEQVLRRKTLREKEQQLRQVHKMEAIGRLAGGIAHEFNNQLTIVKGHCDLLLNELASDNPIREDLEEIRAAALRSTRLTGQLLSYSREQALHPEAINLNDVLEKMKNAIARVMGEKVCLSMQLCNDLKNTNIDPDGVYQMITNLALNARDAMNAKGQLTITTSNVNPEDRDDGQSKAALAGPQVMLSVTDTGVGMDTETRGRIFEPFFTTKSVGEGTGLGLATAYGFIRQSRGDVTVESHPGEGTTFRICFPCIDDASEEL